MELILVSESLCPCLGAHPHAEPDAPAKSAMQELQNIKREEGLLEAGLI